MRIHTVKTPEPFGHYDETLLTLSRSEVADLKRAERIVEKLREQLREWSGVGPQGDPPQQDLDLMMAGIEHGINELLGGPDYEPGKRRSIRLDSQTYFLGKQL